MNDDMKLIALTQGKFAKVDDKNFDRLNKLKWFVHNDGTNFYAARNSKPDSNGKRKMIKMHNEIMNTPIGMEVDHIDHDTLNNQEYNLRICTHRQNMMNQASAKNSASKYLGVSLVINKKSKSISWRARISIDSKLTHLGTAKTEIEAALIYNEYAKKHYGEFANLNIISQ